MSSLEVIPNLASRIQQAPEVKQPAVQVHWGVVVDVSGDTVSVNVSGSSVVVVGVKTLNSYNAAAGDVALLLQVGTDLMALGKLGQFAAGGTGIPLTLVDAKGDLLVGSAADTIVRVPVGSNNTLLRANSGATAGVDWASITTLGLLEKTLVDAKGDLLVATAADTIARLAVGSNNQVLTADSAQTAGVKWADPATSGGTAFHGVSAYHNTTQSLGALGVLDIALNSEDFDTDTYHDTSTNNSRFTVPTGKAGYYRVTAQVGFQAPASDSAYQVIFRKNAANTTASVYLDLYAAGSGANIQVSKTFSLAVNDYIQVRAISLGAANTIQANITWMVMELVGT